MSRTCLSRLMSRVLIAVMAIAPGACTGTLDRLAQVGDQPPLTRIQNPQAVPGYQPVSMPMPPPLPNDRGSNSLWRPGARAFFKDQRANQVGDIVTVLITMSENASLSNSTERTRTNTESAAMPKLLGYEGKELRKVLPEALDPTNLIGLLPVLWTPS